MLTALGATETEDRVYRFAATTVSATLEEIRLATGLSEEEVRLALAGLQERSLVSPTADDPARYVASSPGTIESMIANRMSELRRAQEMLDSLADQYRARRLSANADGAFEVVRGLEALRHHALHMLRTARSEMVNMVKPPVIAIQTRECVRPSNALYSRAIFETGALEVAGALDGIQESTKAGEVRVHTKLPVKMLAIDRRVALVPLAQQDTTPTGILIYPSAVLDGLLALFEYVWDQAVTLHMVDGRAASTAIDATLSLEDRQLLSLLLAGLTDEAIAAHFHVSVRTVQRKVHALMEAANVRTRMQLAWEASRQDWLSTPLDLSLPTPA